MFSSPYHPWGLGCRSYGPQGYPYGVPVLPYSQGMMYQNQSIPQACGQGFPNRPYQSVNPDPFHKSAIAFQSLMDQANLIVQRLVHSKEFARKLMSAAQQSNQELVDQLVKSTGVPADVTTDYNPDEIKFELRSQVEGTDCCLLTMALRWS